MGGGGIETYRGNYSHYVQTISSVIFPGKMCPRRAAV
jgi:hypothetical protein